MSDACAMIPGHFHLMSPSSLRRVAFPSCGAGRDMERLALLVHEGALLLLLEVRVHGAARAPWSRSCARVRWGSLVSCVSLLKWAVPVPVTAVALTAKYSSTYAGTRVVCCLIDDDPPRDLRHSKRRRRAVRSTNRCEKKLARLECTNCALANF